MKRTKTFLLVAVAILVAGVSLMGCSRVPPGYVGVEVNLYGSDRGVDNKVLQTGRYYIGARHELFTYPVFIQQYSFTKDPAEGSPNDESFNFQTAEGVQCNVDVAVQAHANPDKVATLFQTYRSEMSTIIHVNLRSYLRDLFQKYASKLTVEDLYSSKKMDMLSNIQNDLRTTMEPQGVIIDNVSYLSDIRFPPTIAESITAKIKATQDALMRQNEVAKAQAEANIKITQAKGDAQAQIIAAQAQADSNRLVQQSLTPMLLQQQAIKRWDGKLPATSLGGNSVPFINLNP